MKSLNEGNLVKREAVRLMDILKPAWNQRLNRKTMQTEQSKDPMVSVILQALVSPKDNSYLVASLPAYWQKLWKGDVFALPDGCVYSKPAKAFVISKSMRWECLTYFHESIASLHPGIARTRELMRQRVWWPGIDADVQQHCERC